MDVFKAIERRYSYRGNFKPGRISRGVLKRIVAAGLKAPSACNEETTTFVIADGEKQLAALRQLHPMAAMKDARAVIACVTSTKPRPVYHSWNFEAEDCANAIMNMWLAAVALGYATVWIDGHLRIGNRAKAFNRILGVPRGRTVRVILPLGRPVGPGPRRKKKSFNQRAWFNRHAR